MIAVLNQRGDSHNSCEDSYYYQEIGGDIIVGGVFDGCGSGTNPAWASQTLAYLFSQTKIPTLDLVVHSVGLKLGHLFNFFDITSKHLWSTCLLFVFNKKLHTLSVRPFGDGVYYVNGQEYHIDQDNKVEYLVDSIYTRQDMDEYLQKNPVRHYEEVASFQICSDGIKAIQPHQFKTGTITDPLPILLAPPTSPTYLKLKWNLIKRSHFALNDDLTIISYAQDDTDKAG